MAGDSPYAATLAHTRQEAEEGIRGLEAENAALERQRRNDEADLRRLVGASGGERQTARLMDVQERIGATERRLSEIASELAALADASIGDGEVTAALAEFHGVWNALSPREQARV